MFMSLYLDPKVETDSNFCYSNILNKTFPDILQISDIIKCYMNIYRAWALH